MEPTKETAKEKRSVTYYMRALHRDIGFFVVGLVLVYVFSGIVLVYRDIGLMMSDTQVEKKLPPNIEPDQLGKMLHLKDFKVVKTEGDTIYFQAGSYNKATGLAVYTAKQLPIVLQKFVDLHKTTSGNGKHWFAIFFGGLLGFLGISSFWMHKKGTHMFRRGIVIASVGLIITIVVLLF